MLPPKKSHHRINILLTLILMVAFLFSPLAGVGDAADSSQEPDPQVEVEPGLRMQLNADQPFGYLIYFREKPDLSLALDLDWNARGRFVVSQLQETAERSQAKVRAI